MSTTHLKEDEEAVNAVLSEVRQVEKRLDALHARKRDEAC
jgi:hypothetical protein